MKRKISSVTIHFIHNCFILLCYFLLQIVEKQIALFSRNDRQCTVQCTNVANVVVCMTYVYLDSGLCYEILTYA